MGTVCQEDCKGWNGMVNFIRGVPYYTLADQCNTCDVWYPKHILKRCPCCNTLLRHGRSRYGKGCKRNYEKDSSEIKRRIELAMSRGWTLLNPDIWKCVLDYRLSHGIPIKT